MSAEMPCRAWRKLSSRAYVKLSVDAGKLGETSETRVWRRSLEGRASEDQEAAWQDRDYRAALEAAAGAGDLAEFAGGRSYGNAASSSYQQRECCPAAWH